MRHLILVAALVLPAVAPGHAAQSLIASPYPVTVPGAQPLDPHPARVGGPQPIMRDPYPQIMGSDAQGNPPIYRVHRQQQLVPSLSQRRYRVDRP